MLTALIIDDEKLAREKLKHMLLEINDPDLEVIGEARDGLEALEQIESLKPDVIFLDIQMPGLNGFEILRHLKEIPSVIFSTAYDQYAIRAFEENAADYLLKPYDQDRLSTAIAKVKHRPYGKEDLKTTIKKIVTDLVQSPENRFIELLPTRIGSKIRLIKAKDILWFDSEHSMTFAHTENQKYDVRYTLDELEQRLNPRSFFRTHRSIVVNLQFIAEIIPWFNGQFKLVLTNKPKTELMVSRGRVQDLKTLLKW